MPYAQAQFYSISQITALVIGPSLFHWPQTYPTYQHTKRFPTNEPKTWSTPTGVATANHNKHFSNQQVQVLGLTIGAEQVTGAQ